jgi:ParB-like chromosome segregation protein Spo0J
MVPAAKVRANDYNPNKMATQNFDLLRQSIEADGVTQPIVTFYDASQDLYIVVDGFHRFTVLVEHFGCLEVPVVEIGGVEAGRMAATLRHNRARGKHQVDLMGAFVKKLVGLGWDDQQIALHLGMEGEEVLRLRQQVGIARTLSGTSYSKSWVVE